MPNTYDHPSGSASDHSVFGNAGEQTQQFTGRHLVLLREDGVQEGLQAIANATGLSQVCNTCNFESAAVNMEQANEATVFMLDKLQVAVVNGDPDQMASLHATASDNGAILAIEPEQIMYALTESADPFASQMEYLRGYKGAVDHLYEVLAGNRPPPSMPLPDTEMEALHHYFTDTTQFTWGLQATRVHSSHYSGRGVRVAVLDTGFDLDHPDFVGRQISSQSFISGEVVNDLNGHGTHCIGTALGPKTPAGGVRRYGCAYQGEIFVGKVLSNRGSGGDSGILAGINWAITNKCQVISMSLGAPVRRGESYSTLYEAVAQRALRANPGTLIVAAAGNSSNRPNIINPVGRPANCPSILAVAAVDNRLAIARFSDGGLNPNGGGVDLAGPGVNIFSSAPVPAAPNWPPRYYAINGTSMATPHVAGIAALWLEARGGNTSARALWQLLTGNARRLNLPSRDVGAGLVLAPQ